MNAVYYSGVMDLLPSRSGIYFTPAFAVLLYHRVNPHCDPFFWGFPLEIFEAQMQYVARKFRVLSLYEILSRIKRGNAIDPRTIAITFDDGYRDNYLYARPILKKYGLPATLFVATGYIGNAHAMWNDRLAWAVKHTTKRYVLLSCQHQRVLLPLNTLWEKGKSLNYVLEDLKTHTEKEKAALVDELISEMVGTTSGPQSLMLDWSELRALAEENWDIGSHTVNHVILTKVDSSLAAKELRLSKQTLEEKLQRPVTLFAYPNGKSSDFDANSKTLLRDAGYVCGATTLDGLNRADTDCFEIRRHCPWERNLPHFAVKLEYAYWRHRRKGLE